MESLGAKTGEQAGSSAIPSSRHVQGSVKDRLGPSVQCQEHKGVQSVSARRRLFTPPQSVTHGPRETKSNSHNFTRRDREKETSGHDQRDTIKKQRIQAAKDAMEALKCQQEEWATQLRELQKDDVLEDTIRETREDTPQSRPRGGHVYKPPTSQQTGHRQERELFTRPGRTQVIRDKRHVSHRDRESTHSNRIQRRRVESSHRERSGRDNFGGKEDGPGRTQLMGRDRERRARTPQKEISDPVMKRLAELEQELAEMKAGPKVVDIKSPFSSAINSEKADLQKKIPKLDSYDGTGDPYDHTNAYEIVMGYYNFSDAGMCKIFVTTLTKIAKQWIVSLPQGSIGSWKELCSKFHERFGSNRRRGKLTASLMQIKQGSSEPLSKYVQRFREAVGAVTDLDMTQALGFFTTGLDINRSKKLMKNIMFKPPKDLADAYGRAEDFIAMDEAMSTLQQNNKWPDQPKTQEGRTQVWDRIGPKGNNQPKPSFAPRTEPKVYTPLNADRVQILEDIRGKPFFEPPRPRSKGYQGKRNVYCAYHRATGHDTEECYNLKELIEKNVQNGQLVQYVAGREIPIQARLEHRDNGRDDQPIRVVDVITGGMLKKCTGKRRHSASEIVMALSEKSAKHERSFPDAVISFSKEDFPPDDVEPHEGALVITAHVGPVVMKRIMIDNGSSVDVLYSHAYQRMDLEGVKMEVGQESPLYGFGNESVPVIGTVELPVTFGTAPKQMEVLVKFFVVQVDSAYNAILGRTTLSALQAVTSIPHFKMKFPTPGGIGEVKGDLDIARKCYRHTLTSSAIGIGKYKQTLTVDIEPFTEGLTEPLALPAEETEEIELIPGNPDKLIKIGTGLQDTVRSGLIDLLRTYADIFAWTPHDMPGIAKDVAVHKLSVKPDKKPVFQKRRVFAPERQRIIDEEVAKLLDAGVIFEIDYPEWLANVVLVRKQNGKWRVCIDYTDLNKACPKDFYPLPHIDQLIDATSGHALLSFLDAFSGYNQISMHEDDIPKTSFITHRAIYAYRRMSFGLINAGATYQRMMNKVFRKQIGRNMEVYVDDMIVKSMKVQNHLNDLEECFETVRHYNMRLNPTKCTFGLGSGKFLGYLVSRRGIEANPEKIRAILEMKSPQSFKDVQRLTGRIAALRRFMSRSAERCLPFFDTLKGPKNEKTFQWTSECEDAFQGIKRYLSSAPILQKPLSKEILYLYLGVSPLAVGAVLIREDGGRQHPVYYVSHVLRDAETRYPNLEKCVYALIIASRKLRHYFQGRMVVIYTDQPLKKVLHKPDASGRMVAWAMELSQFTLEYKPRTAIKGQALADFIIESMFGKEEEELPTQLDVSIVTGGQSMAVVSWTLYVDGSSTVDSSGAGVILTSPEGFKVQQAIRFGFRATNNEAEYEAILAGLRLARGLEVRSIVIFSDSQLVVKQIQGEYEARGARMVRYLSEVKVLLQRFDSYSLQNIDRDDNSVADALSKLAATHTDSLNGAVYIEVLNEPSISKKEVMRIDRSNCWLTPYIDYLADGKLPSDKVLARKIKLRSAYFCMIDGDLYRRTYSGPMAKCLVPSEADYALREVHEGICGDHMGAKSLAYKLIRQGYYWPTMFQEAKAYVQRCPKCQLNSSIARQPPEELSSVLSPIPFAIWGIDLLGPMPKAQGQMQYIIVAIDYMTKWVEAKPLRRITEQECLKFFKENVVYRFGIPRVLVSDNGTQFVGSNFEDCLRELGIQHRRTSVAHPQSNGQVEVTNRTLLNGIKRRLDEKKGRWPKELQSVLWSYRTTPRTTTGDSPFKLAYGTEALIPVEVGSTSYRVSKFNELYNDKGLRLNLDLLDEVREEAVVRLASYQQKTARHYNRRVRVRRFEVGDFVLREAEASTPQDTGKLMPNWEGPYEIVEVLKAGTYKLRGMDGSELKNTWHAGRLRKYYQ